jgi:fucose 4-O-acetylase-like acetyltransferase
MSKSRIPDLDIVKGFGILLVVLGHMHINEEILNYYLHAFLMPLFFVVSGLLYRQGDIKKATVKRAKALLIPYVSFGAAYWLIYNGYMIIRHHDLSQMLPTGMSFLFFPTDGLAIESALWFLPVMFIASAGYNLLAYKIKNKYALSVTIIILGCFGYAISGLIEYRLPWGINVAFVSLLFFHTGRLMKDHGFYDAVISFRKRSAILFYLCLILLIALNIFLILTNSRTNMRAGQWGIWPLAYFNAALASAIYLIIARLVVGVIKTDILFMRFIERISTNAMIFICISHPAIRLSRFVVNRVTGIFALRVIFIYILSVLILFALSELFCRTRLKVFIGRR